MPKKLKVLSRCADDLLHRLSQIALGRYLKTIFDGKSEVWKYCRRVFDIQGPNKMKPEDIESCAASLSKCGLLDLHGARLRNYQGFPALSAKF